MKLVVKDMDISTGNTLVALLRKKDAAFLDLHRQDRVRVKKGRKEVIAVVDFAYSAKALPVGSIGLFEEVLAPLGAKNGDAVKIFLEKKPESLTFIKKKLDGRELNYTEIKKIIDDTVNNRLTTVELTYYVAANYMRGMSFNEIVALTKAMIHAGNILTLENGNNKNGNKRKPRHIIDKHCIGGVAGNRTTPIVVPSLVVAGLIVPKTSSRSITSPAGTADTMEVLCNVSLSIQDIKRVVKATGGCLVWGGAVHLAPADDTIINVEHPLSIDAEGQLLASIMAKKGSVSATNVIIDIPVGYGTKIPSRKKATHLARQFNKLGKKIGINTNVVLTDGSEPIGNGIGPALEARDVLLVLKRDRRAPLDLRNKSLGIAAVVLEATGKARKGHGWAMAEALLDSGLAHKKFKEICIAQGLKISDEKDIVFGKHRYHVRALHSGIVRSINNRCISRIARLAGCPRDKGAGIYLYKHKRDRVEKGEKIFTIYSESAAKMKYAKGLLKEIGGFVIR